jgi:hypothetical protein
MTDNSSSSSIRFVTLMFNAQGIRISGRRRVASGIVFCMVDEIDERQRRKMMKLGENARQNTIRHPW